MDPKNPREMNEQEYAEWKRHPEWAHWIHLRPTPNRAAKPDRMPPTGSHAFGPAFIVIIFGVIASVSFQGVGLALVGLGLFIGLYGVYQAIQNFSFMFQEYARHRIQNNDKL